MSAIIAMKSIPSFIAALAGWLARPAYAAKGVVIRARGRSEEAELRLDRNSRELLKAVERGDYDGVKRLLPVSNPNGCLDLGSNTPLMLAATKGDVAMVDLLLPGSDVCAKSSSGKTALMHAAARGHLDVLKMLILDSDPNAQDEWGRTALFWAASGGHGAVVEALLPLTSQGVPGSVVLNPLHIASALGFQAIVELLLPTSDPNARSSGGLTALMHAVAKGAIGVVELLLPESDPHARSSGGETALFHAALAGDGRMVDHLAHLYSSADVLHARRTALSVAVREGNVEKSRAIMPLCDYGYVGEPECSLLMDAACVGKVEIVELLLPWFSPNARSHRGDTALGLAARNGHADVVRLLLPLIDPGIANQDGGTALMLAAREGYQAVVEALLPACSHADLVRSICLAAQYDKADTAALIRSFLLAQEESMDLQRSIPEPSAHASHISGEDASTSTMAVPDRPKKRKVSRL